MDLRLTFDEVTEDYGRLRPHYPDALSADLIAYSMLNDSKNALEIGIGAGQATLPFLKTGCALTAVEIGEQLARYSKEKFVEYERFTVINQEFESALLDDESFDMIYSATAFHWIKPEIGFPKVYRLLKSGGVFAWISVQPAPSDRNLHDELEAIYGKYSRYFGDKTLEFDRTPDAIRTQARRVNAFRQFGFVEVVDMLYRDTRSLKASDYATLCGTYSDHRAIPEADRILLLGEIEDAVNRCGGSFTFADTFLLCMGRKP
ncbi:MAG: class I SAM-dependent methyltransferase [Clostridiaceae bacterium]|nr:class I SAM-dependent methyltransferase [Clostridiaceae bacterium]